VTDKRSKVLVAGIGRDPFEGLAPVLDRQELDVVRVATPENSIELAGAEIFDLIIFSADPEEATLKEVVGMIRDLSAASCKASLLVLAEPGSVDVARSLIGRGVNRVMLLADPPALIGRQAADLLDIAPRADVRFSTRLRTSLADGAEEVLGEVVNLSGSGILVETATPFKLGEHVVISIHIGDRDELISAKGKVVRRAVRERGGVDGVGIRFLSFAGAGEVRMNAVLAEALANPPDA
jgi:Tfp pilus assembly protein PilZ